MLYFNKREAARNWLKNSHSKGHTQHRLVDNGSDAQLGKRWAVKVI